MQCKKNHIIFFLIVLVGLLMVDQLHAQKEQIEKSKLEVIYAKNIEVFCTLINLTDYWEKIHTWFPFAIQARDRFLPFQNHQAVNLTREYLKSQWHSFFCHLALCLTDFPEAKLANSPPPELLKLSPIRFDSKEIEDYIAAVRDFYQKSDYEKFWQEKREFYEEIKAPLEEKIKDINIPQIMEDFYGMKKDTYFIVPSPQMPDMGLNVSIVSDGKLYSYYVQGPLIMEKGPDYFINIGNLVTTAIHEFSHTFLQLVLLRHYDLLEKNEYIYEKAKEGMSKLGYQSWYQVFIENLIRALEARLGGKVFDEKFSQLVLDVHSKRGFTLIHILYEITGEYELNRDKYKDFEAFFPDLFIKLDERMKK
ncbi:hypothetical protein CEE39_06655 [bacterium (candidate division B38) B3_B38]|nr:MAG: hypothetical protein CEE39_06655 [bacterium (candidate division B38) B3_B38]